jgi:alginate O-acetyltransferase complex protein AlgI
MLFKFNDLAALGQAVSNIFLSNGKGFSDTQTSLTFKNNLFFLIAALLSCTPIIPALKKLFAKTSATQKVWTAAEVVMPVILLLLSALTLAGDSYNPFLYFQF